MKKFAIVILGAVPLFCQSYSGDLRLKITDPSGNGVKATVHILSEANQYRAVLESGEQGDLEVRWLPYGKYRLDVEEQGFSPFSDMVVIGSSLPTAHLLQLKFPTVDQTVRVNAASTLIDPEQAGSISQIGSELLDKRLSSIPGRSLQELVNSQPGWLYEGNAVLHPRGSEYQTQFVVDGIPLTDNRSPGFGPEIEADDVESMSIYTAGIPAEYGRKMGGIIAVNTIQNAEPGFHGKLVVTGGSYGTAGVFAKGQYKWGRNTLSGSASGSRTDHYLNPVVAQNYSNTGTLGDWSGRYQRDLTPNDRVSLAVRHELSRYDLPNEQLQQTAGQRQNADNVESMGTASYEHTFSSHALADLRGLVRDNANDFNSNAESTPIEVFQNNRFREGYFQGTVTAATGRHEWKFGVESDSTFLQEKLNYSITDPTQFDDGTPLTFDFGAHRPDLEQSVFVQDLIRLDRWTINAGLRWDHYQLLLNQRAVAPRFSVSRYFASADLVTHFSFDRVFQTPSFENILLSDSTAVESLDPTNFFRLPVQPSKGNYYETGLTKAFLGRVSLNVNCFRRDVDNYADDDQIDNTGISFPIALRKSIIYGAEGKLAVPDWGRFSGFLSYSYEVGNAWFPVTGGLFLGDNAEAARTQLTGHFPDSQDQRNTVRGRVRFQVEPLLWIAGGAQYDTGLPFQFSGDPAPLVAEYGQQVLDRINFSRGRIYPSFQVNASLGADIYKSEHTNIQLQADGQNLTNVLDVIDFGGLFSGNAIGPSRSVMLRLATTF